MRNRLSKLKTDSYLFAQKSLLVRRAVSVELVIHQIKLKKEEEKNKKNIFPQPQAKKSLNLRLAENTQSKQKTTVYTN